MSNYLSRLVNRSLNPIHTVQPRLTSRFEPCPNELGQSFEPIQEITEQSVTSQNVGATRPTPPLTKPTTIPSSISRSQQPSRDRPIASNVPTATEISLSAVTPPNTEFTAAIQSTSAETSPDLTLIQVTSLSSITEIQRAESVLMKEPIVEMNQSIPSSPDQTRLLAESPQPSSHLILRLKEPRSPPTRNRLHPQFKSKLDELKCGRLRLPQWHVR